MFNEKKCTATFQIIIYQVYESKLKNVTRAKYVQYISIQTTQRFQGNINFVLIYVPTHSLPCMNKNSQQTHISLYYSGAMNISHGNLDIHFIGLYDYFLKLILQYL